MTIRNIALCLVAMSVLFQSTDVEAKRPRKGKAKEETTAPAKVKKTPYEKFVSKKGIVSRTSFMTVYRDGKDIWLEFPDSVVGRRVMLTGMVASSSSPYISKGMKVSADKVYEVARIDSLLLFLAPRTNVMVADGDTCMVEALKQSKSQAVVMAFPIRYRNGDSTSYVVKATKLFDHANKDLVNLKGKEFNGLVISSAAMEQEFSILKELSASTEHVGVKGESTYNLTLVIPGFGFESTEKPKMTMDVIASLVLLPEDVMQLRKADERIGTRTVSYTCFDSKGQTEEKDFVCRWNLAGERMVSVYVDTLLPVSWQNAVKDGIEKWNDVFEAAGLGKKVSVAPYPSSHEFNPDSPMVSVVTYSGGTMTKASATVFTDSSTGEILSFRMSVPGEYVLGVRRSSVYSISDVDTRYQKYYLDDDAVCDVLTSEIMSLFGRCLGLLPNAAGSAAYSPEQLRDQEFTAVHGITSSVTDNVLFNTFARPGDKERGLVIHSDRPGAYDRYAVKWLYGDFAGVSTETLDSLVAANDGKPEYLYLSSKAAFDSRVNPAALGNDMFAAYDAGVSHLKFVAENADKWLEDSDTESYTSLFIDFLWLRHRELTKMLLSYIGALDAAEVREGTTAPKMKTYPAAIQKKALVKIFESYSDMSWIDSNKALLALSGANKDVSRFTTINSFILSGVMGRLESVAMAEVLAGGDYSPKEYLQDIQDIVLKNARKGRLSPGEDVMIGSYCSWLMSHSGVMKRNYMKAVGKGDGSSFALTEDCAADNGYEFRTSIRTVPAVYKEGLDELCWLSMQGARASLAKGVSVAGNDYDRKCLEYLLYIVDAALGNVD